MHTTQPADELTKKANKQQFFVTSDAHFTMCSYSQ